MKKKKGNEGKRGRGEGKCRWKRRASQGAKNELEKAQRDKEGKNTFGGKWGKGGGLSGRGKKDQIVNEEGD